MATRWVPVLVLMVTAVSTVHSTSSGSDTVPRIDVHDRNATSSPMHIAILSEPNPVTYMSGQSMRFRVLMQHLSEHYSNDKVELVTADAMMDDPPTSCCDGRIPIHYTRGFRMPLYRSLIVSWDWTFRVLRLARARKYDLVHVSSPGFLMIPAILASRLCSIPLVMSYHTHLPLYIQKFVSWPFDKVLQWLTWRWLRVAHSFSTITVVTSPQMADELRLQHVGGGGDGKDKNLCIWPKGVDTDTFHPKFQSREMRHRMSAGHPDELLLVYVGRLAREKRLTDLKAVLQQLQEYGYSGIPTRLCLVGDGPAQEELQAAFEGTPTTFLGRLDGIQLSQALASGDIFVMPSDSETLGFVVLESMASGVPCVAANAGGLKDLIRDGETGFLVPPGDVDSYVAAIQKLLPPNGSNRIYDNIARAARSETEAWSWYASMEYMRGTVYPEAQDIWLQTRRLRRKRWPGNNDKKH